MDLKAGYGTSDRFGGVVRGARRVAAVSRIVNDEAGDRHQQFGPCRRPDARCAVVVRHPFPRSHRLRRPRARHSGALRLGGSGGARCLRNRLRRIYICTEVGWEGKTREST